MKLQKPLGGKKFAFEILVKAQSNKGGWFNYWFEPTEKTFKRLEEVDQEI